MAKDDYDVIVFKILTYLYAVLKRKIVFQNATFQAAIKTDVPEEYFSSIIHMMKSEGLIENVLTVSVWGNEIIIASELSEMRITSSGIHYLKDNTRMKEAKEIILAGASLIASLVTLVL